MKKELSKINLWEQYKRSDALVNYFNFFRNYLNDNYKDLFYKSVKNNDGEIINTEAGKLLKEFSMNGNSEYLEFYLNSVYNMKRPHYLINKIAWDNGFFYDNKFDNEIVWDQPFIAELVPIPLLKKLFTFIYGLKYNYFSIPNLAGLFADFCDVNIHDIVIELDKTTFKQFIVYLPRNQNAIDFKTIYTTYRNIFNLPISCKLLLIIE